MSNIVITKKYGKICQINISFDIDGFTDEPVVQCDVQFVENTLIPNK